MPTYRESNPTFPQPAKRFFHVHIPRTAGRFFQSNILSNGFDIEGTIIPIDKGMEPQHFHTELYERYYDIVNIPHIAIVRDPVDRFISCSIFLKRMYGDIQEAMEDPIMFSSLIENFPLEQGRSWFRPQMDFITSETNLWRFEDGFDKDFDEWMTDLIGSSYVTKDIPYTKLTTDENDKLKKSDKLIDNIRLFYQVDYENLYTN